MSNFQDPLPFSLFICQDMLLRLTEEIETLLKQLADPATRRRFDGAMEYQLWRNQANSALVLKDAQLGELLEHMKTCFRVEYPNKLALVLAIKDRQVPPPYWAIG